MVLGKAMNTLEYVLEKFNIAPKPSGRRPTMVPDFGRDDLAGLFAELGFTTGVEIGVSQGHYSEVLCKANPGLRRYSVDPWLATAYGPVLPPGRAQQPTYDAFYEVAKRRLAPYDCEIIRLPSLEAVTRVADDSLDFVYIDGNHDFQNCTNDICEWTRKVRPGGIISGHDYVQFKRRESNIHVKWVVRAYTSAYNITWFVLGAQASHVPGVVRDKVRSWFWVKQ